VPGQGALAYPEACRGVCLDVCRPTPAPERAVGHRAGVSGGRIGGAVRGSASPREFGPAAIIVRRADSWPPADLPLACPRTRGGIVPTDTGEPAWATTRLWRLDTRATARLTLSRSHPCKCWLLEQAGRPVRVIERASGGIGFARSPRGGSRCAGGRDALAGTSSSGRMTRPRGRCATTRARCCRAGVSWWRVDTATASAALCRGQTGASRPYREGGSAGSRSASAAASPTT
jgi:hypothetical protein